VKFNPGDEILVVDGDFKGQIGSVIGYEEIFERYMVFLPRVSMTNHAACTEDELELLTNKKEEPPETDVVSVPVYDFGIPTDVLRKHLEWMCGRALEKIGDVGPNEAFFGFQEFEGKTASEILIDLMMKLEEGMAMFAQAHVLIGRIVAALESVHDQAK
jgi:hypothetical protein